MRKIIFTLFCSSMAFLAFGQVTLNSSDNGSKSLSTASGGNFSLLRGTGTISTWSGTQSGGTYFVTGHSGGTGIASVASGSSAGSSFSLQITNNTGYTITDLSISGTILLCKDNNTANFTETLSAAGVTGASNWNLSVTSNTNTANDVSVPPASPGSFGGTLTGYSFTTGTNITITWSDANDSGTDAMCLVLK